MAREEEGKRRPIIYIPHLDMYMRKARLGKMPLKESLLCSKYWMDAKFSSPRHCTYAVCVFPRLQKKRQIINSSCLILSSLCSLSCQSPHLNETSLSEFDYSMRLAALKGEDEETKREEKLSFIES